MLLLNQSLFSLPASRSGLPNTLGDWLGRGRSRAAALVLGIMLGMVAAAANASGAAEISPHDWQEAAADATPHAAKTATKVDTKTGSKAAAARTMIWGYATAQGELRLADRPLDARYRLLPGLSQLRASLARAPRAGLWDLSPGYLAIREELERTASLTGLDVDLLRAVVSVESQYRGSEVSPAGAVGLMQVMPQSARGFGLRQDGAVVRERLKHAQTNLLTGARMLRALMLRYPYRLDLALAAYNAGEAAVQRYGMTVPPYQETRRYVAAVSEVYALLKLRAPLLDAAAMPNPSVQVRSASLLNASSSAPLNTAPNLAGASAHAPLPAVQAVAAQ